MNYNPIMVCLLIRILFISKISSQFFILAMDHERIENDESIPTMLINIDVKKLKDQEIRFVSWKTSWKI